MNPIILLILIIPVLGGLIVAARKIVALCPAQQWPAETASDSGALHSKKVALYIGSAISAGLFFFFILRAVVNTGPFFIALCPPVGFSVATFGLSQQGRIRAAVLGLGGLVTVVIGILGYVSYDMVSLAKEIQFLHGSGSGVLVFCFFAVLVVLGALEARAALPGSQVVRLVLGISAGLGLLGCAAQVITVLADGLIGTSLLGRTVFAKDFKILLHPFLLFGLMAMVLAVGLAGAIREQNEKKMANAGFVLAWLAIWLVVGMVVLCNVLQVSAPDIAEVMGTLIAITFFWLLPMVMGAVLCIRGVSLNLIGWMTPTSLGQESSPAISSPMPVPVTNSRIIERSASQAVPTLKPHPDNNETINSNPQPVQAKPNPNEGPPPGDIEEQLKKLKRLYEQGLINEFDYDQKKKDFLTRL